MNISDEAFQEAIKHNNKLMTYASQFFRAHMSDSELSQCQAMGLWKALNCSHAKCKFSTILTKNIQWECIRYLKEQCKSVSITTHPVCSENYDNASLASWAESLNLESQLLIYQRFRDNMTYEEIGNIHGYSATTARRKILKILQILRENYT
jgi:RNA polymerase sigma factor (sigma-70 family)